MKKPGLPGVVESSQPGPGSPLGGTVENRGGSDGLSRCGLVRIRAALIFTTLDQTGKGSVPIGVYGLPVLVHEERGYARYVCGTLLLPHNEMQVRAG